MNYQETSKEALTSFKPVSGQLDKEIMQALRHHPDGITCQAIEDYIKRDHQAVSGNLRHLVENGHAEASGRFGKTRSGRKAILWIVARPKAPMMPLGPFKQMSLL